MPDINFGRVGWLSIIQYELDLGNHVLWQGYPCVAKEMPMLRLFMLLLVVCASQAQAAKESDHLTSVFNLSPDIYDVKGIGDWRKGEAAGQVRLVIARSNKRDEVFLQWVQWGDKGPEKVSATLPIKEIQQEANFKITFIRRETVAGVRQLVLGLKNLYDKSVARAIIEIEGVGRYRCIIR